MPSIDFAEVRARIAIHQVLELCGFEVTESNGDQVRGPCLIHGSSSAASRSFSVNLRKHTFRCFKCGASGNQIDLWVAVSQLPLHEATQELCRRVGVEMPVVKRR
jgi:DNA primase